MKTINIPLPFFPGFYESWLYNPDTELYAIREQADYDDRSEDDYTFNYEKYVEDCCKRYAWSIYLLSPDYVLKVKEATLSSPRYYNYSTDRLFADVSFDNNYIEQMVDYIEQHKEWFTKRIHDDHFPKPGSGYISFLADELPEWIEHLQAEEPNYISYTLAYIMFHEEPHIREFIIEDVLSEIDQQQYVSLKKEDK